MKVLGLDIGNGLGVACLLTEIPSSLLRYFRTNSLMFPGLTPWEFEAWLKENPVDVVVMEPTGTHYSRPYAQIAQEAGVQVLWVGVALAAFRKVHDLPSKNDRADALALAAYGHTYMGQDSRFVWPALEEIRDLCQQIKSLTGHKNAMVNRIHQQLAHELPDMASFDIKRNDAGEPSPFLRYLADMPLGNRAKSYYEKRVKGRSVSEFTKKTAGYYVQMDYLILDLLDQIDQLLSNAAYAPYLRAMAEFRFDTQLQGLILSRVFPFSKFLENGKEIIEHVPRMKGKPTKRNRSLASFKLALGMGMVESQSGDVSRWVMGGPAYLRSCLLNWCSRSIDVEKSYLKTEVGEDLRTYRQQLINGTRPGSPRVVAGLPRQRQSGESVTGTTRKGQMIVIGRAVTLLYRQLRDELIP